MTKYYLGIDVGGSKTHALISDENGNALGFGETGPGNHESVGYAGLVAAMQEATKLACEQAGVSPDGISGGGFGIAGYDWPSERQPTLDAIATLGIHAPVEAVNDAVVGLLAGAQHGWGVGVDAGTGDNVHGLDEEGKLAHMTGCGMMFGEYGGAGTVVMRAIQMISYQWSQRGPATRLSEAFMQLTGARTLDDLLEGLALGKYAYWADTAPLVVKVAEEGDEVARKAIAWVAHELGDSTLAISRQLKFLSREFEIVLIGSMFNAGAVFIEPFKETVLREAKKAKFIRLTVPPVVGGVLLGLKVSGEDPLKTRKALITSTQQLLKGMGKNNLNEKSS